MNNTQSCCSNSIHESGFQADDEKEPTNIIERYFWRIGKAESEKDKLKGECCNSGGGCCD